MSQQKVESPLFQQGLKDGLPICLGYISVAFTFGMMATEGGLAPWSSLLISMTNLTSAGQFAGTALILSGGTLLEIAVTTFVINIRYMLMSLSLSQKLDPDMKMAERLILSFGVTDEVFAVAIRQRKELTARYLAGLILTPYAGWALGTVLGLSLIHIFPPRPTLPHGRSRGICRPSAGFPSKRTRKGCSTSPHICPCRFHPGHKAL